MVSNKGIGQIVRGFFGFNTQVKKQIRIEEEGRINQEFLKTYDTEIVNLLESGDYKGANNSLESKNKEFDEVIQEYIGYKLTNATADLEFVSNSVEYAEDVIETSKNAIDELNQGESEFEKSDINPHVSKAGEYVRGINDTQTTEAIREIFESFYQAAEAADYVIDSQNTELSKYDPEQVKSISLQKARELNDLDREIGTNFMVEEYNELIRGYNSLEDQV